MPIYEFFCPDTRKIYSFYAPNMSYAGKTPRCPDGPRHRMEKRISAFAVTGKAKEKSAQPDAAGGADDPRMERMMAEMERDFGGMSEENPDPRQMARMMKKMSEITGEKMPESMMEMVRRMESGEDPEKLEEEYAGAFDEFEKEEGSEPPGEDASGESRRCRRKRITHDPTLYDIAAYVD